MDLSSTINQTHTMGLDFIRAKEKEFQQRRDYAQLGLDVPDMLDRFNPDRVLELFNVTLRQPDTVLIKGLRILLKFTSDTSAVVSQNGVIIGDMHESDSLELAARMKAAGKTSGMLNMLVASTPDFRRVFQVRVLDGKDLRKP